MSDPDIVIRVRTDGVAGAEQALKRLRDVGVNTEVVTDKTASAFRRQQQAVAASTMAMQAMQSIGIATFLGGLVGAVAKLNDQWTIMTNKLVNANTANERMADVQQRVFEIAQRTRTGLDATATLYARLERSLIQYGASASSIARVTETVNKAMIVSGATAEEANAAIIQLSQGLQSGTLRGDEFRSVAEQAPRLLRAMADALGVTTGELRKMSMEGKLTGPVVAQAIFQASEAIDKEFNNTIATFGQKLTLANNNLIKFAGTNASVGTATGALGDVFVSLSEHLDVVGNVVGVLAAVFAGKMVSSLTSAIAASVASTAAMVQETAAAKALTSAKVQDAAASLQQAQAALVATSAERAKIQAALAANQQYYRGIATMNALMQNTMQARLQTEALGKAQATLNTTIATAITRQTALNAVLATGRTILSLMGGPAGVILLAAGAWYMYNASQERAIENARNLAVDTDTLRDRLAKLTVEQQKGLQVELQRASVVLSERYQKEKNDLAQLNNQLKDAKVAAENKANADWLRADASKKVKELEGDVAIQTAALSKTEQDMAANRENTIVVTNNLAAGENRLALAVDKTNKSMGLADTAAGKRSDDLVRALQSQNAERDVAVLKLKGETRQASILQDVQNRMGKVYAANKEFIDGAIAGSVKYQDSMSAEQKGILEFIDGAGKAYDAQKALSDQKKADANDKRSAKAAERYAEQWDKAYERVEAKGATGLERLRIQQAAEERIMRERAERANASSEELGNALAAIEEKYSRQRLEAVEKYKPGAAMVRDYQLALQEIREGQAAGLINEEQANQARLQLQADYLQKRAQMQGDLNPLGFSQDMMESELSSLQANYETALTIAADNEEQLTLIKENYERARYDIQLKYAQMQAQAQNATTMSYINSISQMAGAMATVLEVAGAKSSGAYKAMFAMSKAFSIANATLNLTTAISQVMAAPESLSPAQKFANMAAIAAAGGSLISQIASATMTGMAHDGITEIPKEGTWLLQKGERVLSAQQNADFTNFMRGGSNTGTSQVSGGNITQYITVSGAGDQALADAVQRATLDGAEQGYSKVLMDTTSRGNISRSIGR